MEFLIYLYFTLIVIYPIYQLLLNIFNVLKIKAKKSIKFRNDLLSFAYLIKDLGPSVSAFSVVELLISSDKEDKITLFLVFIAGIILMIAGRKIRDFIAIKTTENKKSVDLQAIKQNLKN
jgi:hypothetical protein